MFSANAYKWIDFLKFVTICPNIFPLYAQRKKCYAYEQKMYIIKIRASIHSIG